MSGVNQPTGGKKGISILFAILVMSLVLSISFGVNAIILKQMKALTDVGFSVVAFYAADAGIEQWLLARPLVGIPETPLNGATFQVQVKQRGESGCEDFNFCVKSIGIFKGIRRAIEITY